MSFKITESSIELMAIEELESLGYIYIPGIDLAPDSTTSERNSYSVILLMGRLKTALSKLNPNTPADCHCARYVTYRF